MTTQNSRKYCLCEGDRCKKYGMAAYYCHRKYERGLLPKFEIHVDSLNKDERLKNIQNFKLKFEEHTQNEVNENIEILIFKRSKIYEKNRDKFREYHKKYYLSEKGKISARKRSIKRNYIFRKLIKELNEQEMQEIRNFYKNRPIGYEVDHIIPISKGGKHHISNLQYLTGYENRRKGDKILNTLT